MKQFIKYVGLDVHKETITMAVATPMAVKCATLLVAAIAPREFVSFWLRPFAPWP